MFKYIFIERKSTDLGKSEVAAIGEGRADEAAARPDVLVPVRARVVQDR